MTTSLCHFTVSSDFILESSVFITCVFNVHFAFSIQQSSVFSTHPINQFRQAGNRFLGSLKGLQSEALDDRRMKAINLETFCWL